MITIMCVFYLSLVYHERLNRSIKSRRFCVTLGCLICIYFLIEMYYVGFVYTHIFIYGGQQREAAAFMLSNKAIKMCVNRVFMICD